LIPNFYNLSFAEETYFIDMNKLLNQSKAGKEAQDFLKKKIVTGDKKLKEEGELLKKEEIDLIAKKKTLSADEYKKTLNQLREKNIKFQRKRTNFTREIATQRVDARNRLLKALDPILTKYMSENNVQIIIYRKYIVVAQSKLDLTDKILEIFNKELKSLNLK
ncbi:MAG: OmpH family outer membrane protein, partial [Pelagibacteraceae bacterium]|nr:OmpH family outer membrane protein [Pelagibacteraceae bacterium]